MKAADQDSHRHALWALPLLAAAVVALLLARQFWSGLPASLQHPLVGQWAAFCLTYVGVASISLAPAPFGRRVDRLLDAHLQRWGTGLYGLIALSIFVPLELRSFLQTLATTSFDSGLIRELLREWVMGFSMQSLRNAIEAVTWPAAAVRDHGWQGMLALYAACAAVFALGRPLLPEALRETPASEHSAEPPPSA